MSETTEQEKQAQEREEKALEELLLPFRQGDRPPVMSHPHWKRIWETVGVCVRDLDQLFESLSAVPELENRSEQLGAVLQGSEKLAAQLAEAQKGLASALEENEKLAGWFGEERAENERQKKEISGLKRRLTLLEKATKGEG